MIPEPLKGRLDVLVAECDRIGRKDMALALIELGRVMYPESGYEPEGGAEPGSATQGGREGVGIGPGAGPDAVRAHYAAGPAPEAPPRFVPFAAPAPPDTSALRNLLGGLKITFEFPRD
jgi:hypothetical protein